MDAPLSGTCHSKSGLRPNTEYRIPAREPRRQVDRLGSSAHVAFHNAPYGVTRSYSHRNKLLQSRSHRFCPSGPRQLAHGERDEIRGAYNRAEYLVERRRMMQAWSDYLDGLAAGGKVVPIKPIRAA